jgi:hypothetical protein
MAVLTIVEAAGLSGLEPGTIREMIEGGRLRARSVPLVVGCTYLLETDQLDRLPRQHTAPGGTMDRQPSGASTGLESALDGLRAALARWRQASRVRSAENDERPLARPLPNGRTASGPREAELRTLAERVEDLLAPGPQR